MKCIITGANRGLGQALMGVFSKTYDVIPHSRKLYGDLRDDKTLDNLEKMSKGLGLLINNAAIPCTFKQFDELTDKEVRDLIEVNLLAPIRLTHRLYPELKRNHGRIININSICGLENMASRNVYEAAKWGLRGFTNSLRLEGVKVIGVYPTRIKTKDTDEYGMDVQDVANEIYLKFWREEDIIIDGRPDEYKPSNHKTG